MITDRYYHKFRAKPWILGVCSTFAPMWRVKVKWLRIAVLFLLIATKFWPAAVAYVLAGIFIRMKMPEKLGGSYNDDYEYRNNSYMSGTNYSDGFQSSRRQTIDKIKERFDTINRRIENMETIVTSKDYTWEQRLSK